MDERERLVLAERAQDRQRDRMVAADRDGEGAGGRDLGKARLDVLDRNIGDHELRHDNIAEVGEAGKLVRDDAEAAMAPAVAGRDVADGAWPEMLVALGGAVAARV